MTAEQVFATQPPEDGWFRTASADGWFVLTFGGRWTLSSIESLAQPVSVLEPPAGRVRIDLAPLTALDTAGAWLLFRLVRRLRQAGHQVHLSGASPAQTALLARMQNLVEERRPLARPFVWPIRAMVERVGSTTFTVFRRARNLVTFYGMCAVALMRTLVRPERLRVISLLSHIERIGLDAVPIVGLLSFLIGIVLAYQGADQLRTYGAEIFTVNLLGVSVLRELGVLLTAVMVAGRSGSAFTAEIGTMLVNEEIDAMRTMGLDPIEVLVLPRLLAMMIALPLLAFFANMMALFGGAVVSVVVLNISTGQFLAQLSSAIRTTMFWAGIIKAPFFAFLIGMAGCYEGLRVQGGAEGVGRQTTKAVVESIFLVIVADAAFSIFFSSIGI
ncbi:MAG TPA: MlaE family lipid ABC transporter permease subunit [Alphaproteobacteria bacterium]